MRASIAESFSLIGEGHCICGRFLVELPRCIRSPPHFRNFFKFLKTFFSIFTLKTVKVRGLWGKTSFNSYYQYESHEILLENFQKPFKTSENPWSFLNSFRIWYLSKIGESNRCPLRKLWTLDSLEAPGSSVPNGIQK